MAKLRIDPSNPNTYKRMLKEGRGQGVGESYKPWLTVQDLSSRGQSSRLLGWRSGNRLVHLFSKLERDFFYTVEWDRSVVDCREQYLLDMDITLQIAAEKGLAHPTSPVSGLPFPMTTDFVITRIINGVRVDFPRAVKLYSDVCPEVARTRRGKRIAEKLWIEMEYWGRKRQKWALVTEKDFDPILARNVRAVHDYYHQQALSPLTEGDIERVNAELYPEAIQGKEALASLAAACDVRLGLPKGTSLIVARHLVACGRWRIDFCVPFDPCYPIAPQI